MPTMGLIITDQVAYNLMDNGYALIHSYRDSSGLTYRCTYKRNGDYRIRMLRDNLEDVVNHIENALNPHYTENLDDIILTNYIFFDSTLRRSDRESAEVYTPKRLQKNTNKSPLQDFK